MYMNGMGYMLIPACYIYHTTYTIEECMARLVRALWLEGMYAYMPVWLVDVSAYNVTC